MSGLSTLPLNGHALQVRREFILAARIEERFGPLRPLIERLAKGGLTMAEMADLYELAFAGAEKPPSRAAIEEHIFRVGVASAMAPLTELLSALFIGHERFERMRQDRQSRAHGANGAHPMKAASRGAI